MTQSIGSFARNLIATRKDLSNSQIAELVREQFKDQGAKTTMNCIAWYKSNMKKTGYKAVTVVQERTLAAIQAELDEAKNLVEMLEEELELKSNEEAEEIRAKFEYYKALVEKQQA